MERNASDFDNGEDETASSGGVATNIDPDDFSISSQEFSEGVSSDRSDDERGVRENIGTSAEMGKRESQGNTSYEPDVEPDDTKSWTSNDGALMENGTNADSVSRDLQPLPNGRRLDTELSVC